MSVPGQKLINLVNRLYFYFISLPVRILRFMLHPGKLYHLVIDSSNLSIHYSYHRHRFSIWFLELMFYLIDILGIPEFLEIMNDLIHWKNRKLYPEEKLVIDNIFGKSINSNLILIDQYKRYLPKRANAFVGFNTIFFNKNISAILLVHEATHCWQYQHYGSVYIIRALLAQYSGDGYNYGGFTNVKRVLENQNTGIFNYEQQAEIIEDYYKLKSEIFSDLSQLEKEKLIVYQRYINEVLFHNK